MPGDMADSIDLFSAYDHPHHLGYWVTKDGREIHVTHMTDDHLTNAINLMERNGGTQSEIFKALTKEAEERGIR